MKYRYNLEKNSILVEERGIGFEEVIQAINEGNLLLIEDHNNKVKYKNQKIMYVSILEEIYVVPYIKEEDGTLFLKTLYPSRKARKLFKDKK